MKFRIISVAVVAFLLTLPLYGLAHEVGIPLKEQKAQVESSEEQPQHEEREIETYLEETLDVKLAPIQAELEEIHAEVDRPGVVEIVGGIGWIMGILGLAAYMRSRRA